jgi:tRNA-dihydrouridine synthase 1
MQRNALFSFHIHIIFSYSFFVRMTMAVPEEPQNNDVGVGCSSSPLNSNNSNSSNNHTRLPVDRDWLAKLLKRHNNNNNNNNFCPGKALCVAPMVDQSDLPFRLLARKYGANICFTPMIHAKLFCTSAEYRSKFTLADTPATDRPLIAQVCGGDAATILKACLMIQPFADGIDINCGCPQQIAKRGKYGAFLLEETETLVELCQVLCRSLNIPVSVKVRLLPAATRDESVKKSLALYTLLVDAGIHMLTIHGRTRFQKGPSIGPCDWDAVKQVVDLLGQRIPILANGSISSAAQAVECLQATGADGVMSSEAILEYPPLFLPEPVVRVGRVQLAREYLDLCRLYPPDKGGQGSGTKCVRAHLHKFLHKNMQDDYAVRKIVIDAETLEDLEQVVTYLEDLQKAQEHNVETESLSWYMRHQSQVTDKLGVVTTINLAKVQQQTEAAVKSTELVDDAGDCFTCLFDGNE